MIMSDTDDTFNFILSMCYTQLFNLLCEKADDVYGGRLPVHVRCLIDECANVGQIPKLEKLIATIRSREISACLVLQAQSQLKAIYKDHCDTIISLRKAYNLCEATTDFKVMRLGMMNMVHEGTNVWWKLSTSFPGVLTMNGRWKNRCCV